MFNKKRLTTRIIRDISSLFLAVSTLYSAASFASEKTATKALEDKTITAKDLTPYSQRGIQDEVFYFVLPDRFNNGDKNNDMGAKDKPLSYGGFNPEDEKAYHGGDLPGLTAKLPYLEQMGITSIWLTPILRNQAQQGDISGYHGYWVLDFTELDPHLGSNADLKNFIDSAHARNIKVFFDIITNHTADVVKYKECHGEDGSGWSESGEACPYISLADIKAGKKYTTVIQKGNEHLKTPAWLNDPKHYHNQGDSTFQGENSLNGDFFGLDDLNTESPEVVQGMTDIYKNIITQFRPDGFRIDTVKHVNIEFWQQFIPALDKHAKDLGISNFFMFGEVYSGDPKELSYFTTTGTMDSVLDFGLQSGIYNTLIHNKGTEYLSEVFAQDGLYKNANQLLNFTGNHDMGRFAYLLNSHDKKYSAQQTAERLKLATAITFFARGIPVIYYGDEQGFVGDGGNHDSRQDMMPSKVATFNDDDLLLTTQTTADDNFSQDHPLYRHFATLANLYHKHPALRYGKQAEVFASKEVGLYAFTRTYKDSQYLVVLNTAEHSKEQQLPISGKLSTVFSSGNSSVLESDQQTTIELSGISFVIYQID